jgi:hypothetical protein
VFQSGLEVAMKLIDGIKRNLSEMLAPGLFFLVAFCLILVTKRLILSEYGIPWTGFTSAFMGAILIAKVVLYVDKLPLAAKYTDRHLLRTASRKCVIYVLVSVLYQYLDRIVPLSLKHGSLGEAHKIYMAELVWPHFWLVQMWLLVLFFCYCTLRELVRTIGKEKVRQLLF